MTLADFAGRKRWHRPATPYEEFMEAQGVPIHRGVGVRDTRELTLAPWKRLGGNGAFVELDGTGGLMGIYIVEIPGGGALEPEKHMFEEVAYVLEGRGTTEVWNDGSSKKQVFEWQAGSVFSPPLNTWHRLVNAASSPALVIFSTNAPPIIDMYKNTTFIFNNPFDFTDRFDSSDAYFKPTELRPEPTSQRALNSDAVVPDANNCELPLDGQRGSGHRHFFLNMSGNFFRGFIAQYPPGRYSKAHFHESGPVLICLRGSGYTLTWPTSAGTRPWENGNADLVKRQDYVQGGIVSAAPGGANWFHQHFGAAKESLRVMAYLGGYPRRVWGKPGDEVSWNTDVSEGGNTIEYPDEDPMIRTLFKEALAKNGGTFDMNEALFQRKDGANKAASGGRLAW